MSTFVHTLHVTLAGVWLGVVFTTLVSPMRSMYCSCCYSVS
jgi:hypothetical protein